MRENNLSLRYGHGTRNFTVPESAHVLDIVQPQRSVNRAAFQQGLAEVLPNSIPEGPVAIVVADKTRLCGYPTALPWLLEILQARGVDRNRIVFFIAYGNHAPQTESDSLAAYGPIFRDYPFLHHCSTEPDLFVELGTTRRGTPIRLRKDLLAAGMIITVGAISHHYFAGFGGGRKLLFPGLAEQQAIYHNHGLFLDSHTGNLASGCRPGRLKGNPIAEDLAEIERRLPGYISIHGLLDSSGEIIDYRFGRSYEDFLNVCEEHDRYYRANTDSRYDLVLASAGGSPKDINMIQTHKAIDNGAAFVRDGGTLVLLAECPEGLGSTTFLPYFEMGGWQAAFEHLLDRYSGNGGTALSLMAKTGRIRICLLTALPHDLCARIGITRVESEEVTELLSHAASNILVIKNSSMLIL